MDFDLEFSERWLPVAGYEGWYEVSDFGRIRSLARTVVANDGRVYHHKGHLLVGRKNGKGYLCVVLCQESKRKDSRIHQLVAEAFLGPCPLKHEIDHKNGNKLDNSVENLEYVTGKENMKRAWTSGLFKNAIRSGERHAMAKLDQHQVAEIRRLYLEGFSQRKLAAQFGVTQPNVGSIVRNETWKKPKES